jgi:hypothetical protein
MGFAVAGSASTAEIINKNKNKRVKILNFFTAGL